jgi:hypothetical protein
LVLTPRTCAPPRACHDHGLNRSVSAARGPPRCPRGAAASMQAAAHALAIPLDARPSVASRQRHRSIGACGIMHSSSSSKPDRLRLASHSRTTGAAPSIPHRRRCSARRAARSRAPQAIHAATPPRRRRCGPHSAALVHLQACTAPTVHGSASTAWQRTTSSSPHSGCTPGHVQLTGARLRAAHAAPTRRRRARARCAPACAPRRQRAWG